MSLRESLLLEVELTGCFQYILSSVFEGSSRKEGSEEQTEVCEEGKGH